MPDQPWIAILGSRGIPARYGGFETLAEELAKRLVERGFRVTVYCRAHLTPKQTTTHRGVELVVLPTIETKHLDTPIHTLLSCLHASRHAYDAVLMVNSINVFFVPLLQLGGASVALNVDGIEWQRAKWGRLARTGYRLAERLCVSIPDRLITDAEVIRNHYKRRYRTNSTTVAYGVEPQPTPPGETLQRLGLQPDGYFLYVSRFEPENNPHVVARAYRSVAGGTPLVMVGGAPYSSSFVDSFTNNADSRVLFPGPIYGLGYRELLSHALGYVQASEVGGTHPSLVEAMGYGNCLIVNDTPENREVAGDAAIYFRADDPVTLTQALDRVQNDLQLRTALSSAAATRAAERYTWDSICRVYERLLLDLCE